MAANRKIGLPSDQRVALLRNLTTALIWNGKIVTTVARAKEVRAIAEKIITLAVREYENSETVEKETRNEKAQIV
ncbi:MAG: bL17 family ribosomal protein, partial [Clostridiales bacterium]|nr:bL17 family ribosomal protein [Clostridiales bacterium]